MKAPTVDPMGLKTKNDLLVEIGPENYVLGHSSFRPLAGQQVRDKRLNPCHSSFLINNYRLVFKFY